MRTTKLLLMVTVLGLATIAMNANAATVVSAYVCKNNKGSQIHFVNNPFDCGNGEQAVQLEFTADSFQQLNDTDYQLNSGSQGSLFCTPYYNSYGVTGTRLNDYSNVSCSYGSFMTNITRTNTYIYANCRTGDNANEPASLSIRCRLDAKTE